MMKYLIPIAGMFFISRDLPFSSEPVFAMALIFLQMVSTCIFFVGIFYIIATLFIK